MVFGSAAQHSLDLIELGALVVETFDEQRPVLRNYPLLVKITVEATDEDEAKLHVERLLAGRFDHRFVALVDTKGRT